jgi:translation initiation factor IF-2
MPENEKTSIRLSKVARELNIAMPTIVDYLSGKGIDIETNPNTKIDEDAYHLLLDQFKAEKHIKQEAEQVKKTLSFHDVPETAAKPSRREKEPETILIKSSSFEAPKDLPQVKPKEEKQEKKKSEEMEVVKPKVKEPTVKVVGKIDLGTTKNFRKKEVEKPEKEAKKEDKPEEKPAKEAPAPVAEEKPKEPEIEAPAPPPAEGKPAGKEEDVFRVSREKLSGPNIVGKIDLPAERKPVASSSASFEDKLSRKRKRKRTDKKPQGGGTTTPRQVHTPASQQKDNRYKGRKDQKGPARVEPTDKEIQDQIKATLARLSGTGKSKSRSGKKIRREAENEEQQAQAEAQKNIIKVTEFVSANELARLMNVQVTQIIATCMSLGIFVSINQRLDAETLTIVAEEFGYKVEFVSAEVQEAIQEEQDKPEDLLERSPIVTVMGHVDHGKTSLLDYVRKANVIAGEAGGITQHMGAYEVKMENERSITFLDTPGHEAFTAMRARGAKVTDVAIIVVAADDSVMPQTVEAINHAQAAGVPLVFAINKIDKPTSNPEKIKEQLANMNILVEDWGGKYQCQEISAKQGLNVDKLLEKVLLEAEILELKANPNKMAIGTVIESSLDKGRGYVATLLVQSGTLKVGDIMLAGCHSGRVRAMFNERGNPIDEAGPSAPVRVLGLDGAPQAGDKFNIMRDEREARDIANKRLQLQREQQIRTHKHITLDEIGRRLAIGNFKELNVIVKGDVDGSVEALADSLLKLSSEEIQINVIHKSVGQITESDVLLASASNAIIIGFQVRPSMNARKLAENEQIEIRLYSIIYDAINELKSAMEGMLAPEYEEKIVCNVEIREIFKIPKVGTIAGCMVLDGKITRNTKVRVVREGIVVYTGQLASLKRFKDDVKEVSTGYECGLNIENFNDIKVGDIVEGYDQIAVKRTLA